MARTRKGEPPAYRRKKVRSHEYAYVRLNGEQIMLGHYGTEESRREYVRVIAEWEAAGRRLPAEWTQEPCTIDELAEGYLGYCEDNYLRADGTPTREKENAELSLRKLREIYGDLPAEEFGLAQLKAVRHQLVESGLARKSVNSRVSRIVRVFGWAADEMRVKAEVFGTLRALRPLKRGRTKARETKPVDPVPWAHVEPVLGIVSRPVAAMIELQWHTGARPGEVLQLRPCDVDRSEAVWIYRPEHHKTEHHSKDRIIALGPRAQDVLRPFLDRVPRPSADAPLFSPRNALAEHNAERRRNRRSPLWDSHLQRYVTQRKKRPKRAPSEAYSINSYRAAIHRACDRASVPRWSPNQLRHSAATRIRKEEGIEAARVVLGHTSAAVTEIYAHADQLRALEVMGRLG